MPLEQKEHSPILFSKSDSSVLSLGNSFVNKFKGEQLWGSATLLVQLAFGRRWWIKGGFDRENPAIGKGKDWTRIISGAMHATGDIVYFLSDRGGDIPEGKAFLERMRNTALHPGKYPVRTRFLMAASTNVLSVAGDVYYGMKGGETEKIRLQSAGLTVLYTVLQLWSMFKKSHDSKTAPGKPQAQPELKSFRESSSEVVAASSKFLKLIQFALKNQLPYVTAYAIEQGIQVTRLVEGRKKVLPGPEQNVKEGSQMIKRASLTMVIATSNLLYNIRQMMRAEMEVSAQQLTR